MRGFGFMRRSCPDRQLDAAIAPLVDQEMVFFFFFWGGGGVYHPE